MTWGGEEAFSDSQGLLADKMRAAGVLHESFVQPTMAHNALLAATLSFNLGLHRGDPHNFEASAAFIAMVKWTSRAWGLTGCRVAAAVGSLEL